MKPTVAGGSRRIPAAGINLFQLIYILIREYEEKSGRKAMNLSLGNPDGVPPAKILELTGRFTRDPKFEYHTYAEDNDLNGFAAAMVELHGRVRVSEHPHLRALPIPGIKTAGALIPLACGLHLRSADVRARFRVVSNLPAYDIIGTWAGAYLGEHRVVWPLTVSDGMRPKISRLRAALGAAGVERPDLIYVIRPGNPASVGASRAEWDELILFCVENGTRLVNDGAYAGLSDSSHIPLAAAAKDAGALEWLELYSVSKSFSDPGARLGALVGSKAFVEDYAMIKGNADSGPVPGVMAAYGEFFKDRAATKGALVELYRMYRARLDYLTGKLEGAGLRPACRTDAGFFTLWKVPKRALGVDLASDPRTRDLPAHEAFNRLVITETGIVGVHFRGPGEDGSGDPMIRYAVCSDVLDPEFQKRFEEQLGRLKPEY